MTPAQAIADSTVTAAYTDLASVERFEVWAALALVCLINFLWMMAIGSKDKLNIRVMFVLMSLAAANLYMQVVQAKKANRATAVYAAEKLAELRSKWHSE